MTKTPLTIFLCIITLIVTAQSFNYKSNLQYDASINDALELNGKFYLVGSIDSSGIEKPYFCILNNDGNLIFDTIINSSGNFLNIHEVNNILHITHFINPFPRFHTFFDLQYDTNFVFQNGIVVGDGVLQKSKLINDSTILYIGFEPPPFANSTYTSFVVKQEINTGNIVANIQSFSVNPMEVYDIISPRSGNYHLYLNSPDSLVQDQVSVLYLNDSLEVYRNLQLNSSYNSFGSDSTIRGTVAAEFKSDNIYMNCIANHPTYFNQVNNKDLALIQYDTNYNELSISFSGKSDTNYTTSRSSIALNANSIFTGGTGFDEVLLNQYDTAGNLVKFAFYNDGTKLELKKVLAFEDSLLIVGNTDNQFFALKIDSITNQLISNLDEIQINKINKVLIFPNPAKEFIKLNINSFKIKKFEIYTQSGTLIKVFNQPNSSILNIEDLKTGMYILKITTKENQIKSILFIKI